MGIISSNIIEIITVGLLILGLLVLYREGKKTFVRRVILSLVVQAEKALGSGTGELKYAMVIDNVYYRLSWIIRLLFNKKDIDNFIEDSVSRIKLLLSEGKDLLGYSEECMVNSTNN